METKRYHWVRKYRELCKAMGVCRCSRPRFPGRKQCRTCLWKDANRRKGIDAGNLNK